MKRLSTLFCIAFGLAIFPISVDAQSTGPNTGQNIPNPSEKSYRGISMIPVPEGPTPRAARKTKSGPKREDRIVKKGIFAPAESDVNAHMSILSQHKTGIMRLLPREAFDWQSYKVAKRVDVRGGGSFFSFFNLSHDSNYGADIWYEKGQLIAGGSGGPDYGFLADLGDTPLEPFVASDPRADFSRLYTPPRKEYEARIEQRTFRFVFPSHGDAAGVTIDGALYRKNLPAKLHHTYLLRSISYNKSDLLVAFRVVRISEDGGLTIAWKILKEFEPPRLLRVVHVRDLNYCSPNCK